MRSKQSSVLVALLLALAGGQLVLSQSAMVPPLQAAELYQLTAPAKLFAEGGDPAISFETRRSQSPADDLWPVQLVGSTQVVQQLSSAKDLELPLPLPCHGHQWFGRAGALFVGRSRRVDVAAIQKRKCLLACPPGANEPCGGCDCGGGCVSCGGGGPDPGMPVCSTIDDLLEVADGQFGVGPRVSIMRLHKCDTGWEVGYFGIDGWDSRYAYEGDLIVLGKDVGVGAADARFRSNLHSLEVNAIRPISPWTSLVAGARWIRFEDLTSFSGAGNIAALEQTFRTRNNLVGFQLGAITTLWDRGGLFTVNGIGKAGAFYNAIEQKSAGDTAGRQFDDRLSFVADLEIVGSYRLTNHWSASAGYQVVWLEGVALAADQFSRPDVARDGSLFLHGLNVGMQYAW